MYPFAVSKNNPLEDLGAKYLPSKRNHNYLTYYWLHFRDIRFEVKHFLEIGVQTDRSIKMWADFFPNAMIYGIDIDPKCKSFENERCKIFIGDQNNQHFLFQVSNEISHPIDIIIDDGSHKPAHQLNTFSFLFPRMSEHGIYVVEDTGGAVADYNLKTVNTLKKLVDNIMYWPKGFNPKYWEHLTSFPDDASWSDKHIVGIAFYRWIVFIMRGNNPEDNPYLSQMPSGSKEKGS